jgi:hypothetical protein
VHVAPANNAPHIDNVNVCPALAVTPHTGSLEVSVLVWLAVKSRHNDSDVGIIVGTGLGTTVGAVG